MEALKLGIPYCSRWSELINTFPVDYIRKRLLKYAILPRISVPICPKEVPYCPNI